MARTRAQDYDTKRLAILHKSAELFAQFGYSGTSITMIADACGVSKALLYHYYPDKEALLFDIISDHLDALIQVVEEAASGASDPQERLFAISAGLLEAYRDADSQHQIQIANLKLLPQEKQDVLRELERVLVRLFSDALAEAVPQVGRGPMLKPLTMSLFGMLNWHYLWFREGKGLSRTEYARLVTTLLQAGAQEAVAVVATSAPAEAAGKTAVAEAKIETNVARTAIEPAFVSSPVKPRKRAAARPRKVASGD